MKKYFKIIPLGGVGKIGFRNCTVYENEESIVVVDMGLAFSDETTPGADFTIADTKYLEKNLNKIKAIIITHAHYDHIGGLVQMWRKVPAPLYVRPFGLEVIKNFFAYKKEKFPAKTVEIESNKEYKVGKDFSFELVNLIHSIPQSGGLYFKINGKKVFHSGDFRFDETPILPEQTDYKRLKEIGEEKPDLLLVDSTSVFSENTMSESEIKENTLRYCEQAESAIAICCFASNVSRVLMTLEIAEALNKKVVVLGGSLQNTLNAAVTTKIINSKLVEKVVRRLEEVDNLGRENLIILGTGSQGEMMSAMARLARDEMPKVRLVEGDTMIHSAMAVPGNEASVWNMFELLAERGIKIKAKIFGDKVHASGHATKGDLINFFEMLNPKVIIPVHGTIQHMQAVSDLIEDTANIPCTISYREFLQIAEDNVLEVRGFEDEKLLDETTEFAVDGGIEVPHEDYFIFKQRRFMHEQGAVFISLAINRNGQIMAQPSITSKGLGEEGKMQKVYQYALTNIYRELKAKGLDKRITDKEKAREAIRISGRRAFINHRGKKPMTVVDFIEI